MSLALLHYYHTDKTCPAAMLKEFLSYIESNHLVNKDDYVLLAVSGGIDSMVMTDLFVRAGISIGIAHCNFTLRGEESEKDEMLVRNHAEKHNLPFFSVRFDTESYSREKGISIQMAARELRYNWFEEIRENKGFSSVAVAHNLNDSIETFLINLIRGTGIAGLTGIRKSRGKIIRPLLFASRQSIMDYCRDNNIIYREDRSNSEIKYLRNKIRHLILPLLTDLNPSIETTLNETADRLSDINEILSVFIAEKKEEIFTKSGDTFIAELGKLNEFASNKTMLFELFRPFGLTPGELNDLIKLIKGKTGSRLITGTHRIIRNRHEIILGDLSDNKEDIVTANNISELRKYPLIESVRVLRITEKFRIPSGQETACLDYGKISYPLRFRNWYHGDYFFPLGMKHKKKLSDYLIDRKFPVFKKEKTRIMESDGNIVWIVGERIDDRFKVTSGTEKALIIKLRDKP